MIDQEALSPEKRAQILEGAASVFAQDGYEGSSMSRIARQANVSKGTLYNHFDSKASLFKAFVQQSCMRYLMPLFATLETGEELEAMLHRLGGRMVGMMLTPSVRTIYRMVVSEAEEFPELAEAFYQSGPRLATGALARWIEEQVKLGRLLVADTDFAAEQFFSLCQTRLAMRYRLHLQPVPSEAEVADVVNGAVRMFLDHYRPLPASA